MIIVVNGQAIDEYLASTGRIEPLQERNARGLARAGRPDQSDHLAGPNAERDVPENGRVRPRRIAEADRAEFNGSPQSATGRLVSIRHGGGQPRSDAQVLEHLLGGSGRTHQARVDVGEAFEAAGQRELKDHEGNEVAAAYLTGGDQMGAVGEHAHGHGQLAEANRPVVAGVHQALANRVLEDLAETQAVGVYLAVFVGERAHRANGRKSLKTKKKKNAINVFFLNLHSD